MLMGCFGSFGASAPAHTVSAIQSGVNIVVYQATCPYPSFHWIQIWDGKCFLKSSLLEQGFVMHLGHNGQSCPVQRNPLDDQWLEQMKRRSKKRIYLKIFLRLWAIKILLPLLTAMGFSITTSNGVLAQDLPHITSNCSDMVCFQPVSSSPRLLYI